MHVNTSLKISDAELQPEAAIRAIQKNSRYFFKATEFAALVGRPAGSPGVDKALYRLAKAGVLAHATKRPPGWLIVPPEQAHYGAPPVTWWLNDCMMALELDYYVALLSAARHWGSAHYAVQTTQVMISKPRPALTLGKLKVEFFSKRSLENTPTIVVATGVAPWRVSTREATLFDLVRHQTVVGGIESIARIARDFGPELLGNNMIQAANASGQVPAAQRLGFLLDRLQLQRPANRLNEWLSSRRVPIQALELGETGEQEVQLVDARWNIRYNMKHLRMLEEVI
jgi:predicted transcriptional regulator of viral defense system